jgi:hypothetical protein
MVWLLQVAGSFNDWKVPGIRLQTYTDDFHMSEVCMPAGIHQVRGKQWFAIINLTQSQSQTQSQTQSAQPNLNLNLKLNLKLKLS